MTADQFPIVLIALTVGGYWFRVAQMARRTKRRIGRAANFIPTETTGRWNRILWVPAIIAWIVQSFYSAFDASPEPPFAPLWHPNLIVKWLLAGVVVTCGLLTTICWKRMGKSWRMGIDPNERTSLIVSGPYAYVRHPIYALSLVMMSATMLAIGSPVILVAGAIHLGFLIWEARREEQHLTSVHGETYVQYCNGTGRFFPKPFGRSQASVAR